jgi:lipoyl(octanoyl) transferase
MMHPDAPPVPLEIAPAPVPYPEAVARMESRVAAIHAGTADELVWFVEHPPVYTAGTSAKPGDLIAPDRFPVFRTGRGGQYTYHGPGQRVVYVLLDLARQGKDVRRFVDALEEWAIRALARFDVVAERRAGRVGLWVPRGAGRDDKIAAIGVRIRHWISFHGMAINVDPDLSHYAGIVPCGVTEHGVTSLAALGKTCRLADLDAALMETFPDVFGRKFEVGRGLGGIPEVNRWHGAS